MFERVVNWIRVNPWRIAAIVLGIGFVAALAFLLMASDSSEAADSSEAVDDSNETQATGTVPVAPVGPEDGTDGSPGSENSAGGFLAVKVDNAPGARPQVGIGSAPLLVEVPVEGGMTRFVAVYPRDASGYVGPVRSLRPVDVDLLPPLAVHVVSTGGQPFVRQAMEATGIQQIDPLVFDQFESAGREIPHDTFLDLDVLMPLITGSETEAVGLPFGELPSANGEASAIDIPFGSVEFRFADGVYVRFEDGNAVEVLDSLGGQLAPLAHDTVIVMSVAERPAGYEDSNGVPVATFDVIGSGDLLVFHNGDVVEGTWFRSAQADPFLFLDAAGNLFGIPSASTYLALVPRDQQTTFVP